MLIGRTPTSDRERVSLDFILHDLATRVDLERPPSVVGTLSSKEAGTGVDLNGVDAVNVVQGSSDIE